MDKVLIFRDNESLNKVLARATSLVENIQNLYDALNANNLSYSFENVKTFVSSDIYRSKNNQGNAYNRLAEVVSLLKVIIADNESSTASSALGFAVSREKLLEMIEPDQTVVEDISDILAMFNIYDITLFDYLTFDSETDTISLASDYETSVTDKYSIYADNQRQIDIVNALNSVITGLVAVAQATNERLHQVSIDGLKMSNPNEYFIDYMFVKKY